MQGNAPIHRAKCVLDWLSDHGINVMQWPTHSPHLSPIKHLWYELKNMDFELNPGLRE